MKSIHIPLVNGRYWTAIALASVFGTNLGDFYADQIPLGLLGGASILGAVAIAVFLIERRDHTQHEVYYWLLIILIRTGATNLSDTIWELDEGWQHDGPALIRISAIGTTITAVMFLIPVCLSVFAGNVKQRGTETTRGMPKTGVIYWVAMLGAGIFGTFFGDVMQTVWLALRGAWPSSHAAMFQERLDVALALYVVLILSWFAWRRNTSGRLWVYWVVVGVARTAGTVSGDFLAQSTSLGLSFSTLLTGTAFLLVLIAWPRRDRLSLPLNADA